MSKYNPLSAYAIVMRDKFPQVSPDSILYRYLQESDETGLSNKDLESLYEQGLENGDWYFEDEDGFTTFDETYFEEAVEASIREQLPLATPEVIEAAYLGEPYCDHPKPKVEQGICLKIWRSDYLCLQCRLSNPVFQRDIVNAPGFRVGNLLADLFAK